MVKKKAAPKYHIQQPAVAKAILDLATFKSSKHDIETEDKPFTRFRSKGRNERYAGTIKKQAVYAREHKQTTKHEVVWNNPPIGDKKHGWHTTTELEGRHETKPIDSRIRKLLHKEGILERNKRQTAKLSGQGATYTWDNQTVERLKPTAEALEAILRILEPIQLLDLITTDYYANIPEEERLKPYTRFFHALFPNNPKTRQQVVQALKQYPVRQHRRYEPHPAELVGEFLPALFLLYIKHPNQFAGVWNQLLKTLGIKPREESILEIMGLINLTYWTTVYNDVLNALLHSQQTNITPEQTSNLSSAFMLLRHAGVGASIVHEVWGAQALVEGVTITPADVKKITKSKKRGVRT